MARIGLIKISTTTVFKIFAQIARLRLAIFVRILVVGHGMQSEAVVDIVGVNELIINFSSNLQILRVKQEVRLRIAAVLRGTSRVQNQHFGP